MNSGLTFSDAGTVTFSSGDQVLVDDTELSVSGSLSASGDHVTVDDTELSVSGSLTANGTDFINGGYGPTITFTSTATLSGGTNTFNLPIYVPYTLVPSLANDTSFDQIEIEAGTISSGNLSLNLIGDNPSMSYVFPYAFTVDAGASMVVGANLQVTMNSELTFSDAGMVTFSSGDQVLVDDTELSVSGSLSASGDQVTVAESDLSVSGSLTASGTEFINGGYGPNFTFTSTATLSGGSNSFNLPIYVPYTLVPSLANDTSFDQIEIEAGTISSGTLSLNLIGDNPSMSYVFPYAFTVDAGALMVVGANLQVTMNSELTFSDAGMVTFSSGDQVLVDDTELSVSGSLSASGDQVTVAESDLSVSGSLTANGTEFINGGYGPNFTFTSTATLSGGSNSFNLPIYVPYTLVPSLANDTSFDQIEIEAGTISSGTLSLNLIGDNPSMSYVFPYAFTVDAGASMVVGANLQVTMNSELTFSDAGMVTFSSGDQVLVDDTELSVSGSLIASGDQVTVAESDLSVSGSLTANGTDFINGGYGPNFTFTSTATLSGGSNSFNLPIYVPYTDVASLAGNTSFDQVEIEHGTISSGTLTLNPIGNSTNFSFIIPQRLHGGQRRDDWPSVRTCRSRSRRARR